MSPCDVWLLIYLVRSFVTLFFLKAWFPKGEPCVPAVRSVSNCTRVVPNHLDSIRVLSSANKSVYEKGARSEPMPFVSLPRLSSSAEPLCISSVHCLRLMKFVSMVFGGCFFLSSYHISSLLRERRGVSPVPLGSYSPHGTTGPRLSHSLPCVCTPHAARHTAGPQEAFVGWMDEWELAFRGLWLRLPCALPLSPLDEKLAFVSWN